MQDGWIRAAVAGDDSIKIEAKAAVKVSPKEDFSMLPPSILKTGCVHLRGDMLTDRWLDQSLTLLFCEGLPFPRVPQDNCSDGCV